MQSIYWVDDFAGDPSGPDAPYRYGLPELNENDRFVTEVLCRDVRFAEKLARSIRTTVSNAVVP